MPSGQSRLREERKQSLAVATNPDRQYTKSPCLLLLQPKLIRDRPTRGERVAVHKFHRRVSESCQTCLEGILAKEQHMTSGKLQGIRVAILVSDGFKEFEMLDTRRTLDQAGAATFVVGITKDKVMGLNPSGGEAELPVDIHLKSAIPQDFHALLLPGGSLHVKNLMHRDDAIEFLKDFMIGNKPVASIGEAAVLLICTGTLRGRTLTTDPSVAPDLAKAGANYIGGNIAVDGNLLSARGLEDVPALTLELIRILAAIREHSTGMRKLA